MEEKGIEILKEQGTAAAIEFLTGQEDPAEAAKTFNALARHAYWKQKDVPAMVALSQAGIAACLEKSAQTGDSDLAASLKDSAKGIAYNLASFAWPGWGEEGITLNAEQVALGMEAAQTSLQLVAELEKGDLQMSRGHWMVGAQQIAASQYGEAKSSFAEAVKYAEAADSAADALLSQGYTQVVQLLESPGDDSAQTELDALKAELLKGEDGEFFIGQLDAALRVFSA